jgi:hypothetical protein
MTLRSYTTSQTARLNWWRIHSRSKCCLWGKGTATVFCDVYGVLLVDSTPHGSTINAAPYRETLKRDSRRLSVKRDHNANERISPAQWRWTSQYCSNGGSLDLLGLVNPSTTITMSWCELSDVHLIPKIKKYLRGQHFHSDVDVQNEVKKWLCAQDAIFMYKKDFTNWYITTVANRFSIVVY